VWLLLIQSIYYKKTQMLHMQTVKCNSIVLDVENMYTSLVTSFNVLYSGMACFESFLVSIHRQYPTLLLCLAT